MHHSVCFTFCLILLPSISRSFHNFHNTVDSAKIIASTDQNKDVTKESEDAELNIIELAKKYQYEIEEHSVVTEDGYILKIHRLPAKGKQNGGIFFLMHGILDSSDTWLLQGPGNSLAYILADKGYDVWLGNARGNKYSSNHSYLNNNQSEYWKFSWDEIGNYDLPAMIDYTLNVTKKPNLYYGGHSQGTTTFFVMTSLRPNYNNKVRIMFALSPIAWFGHAKSPIIKMAANFQYLLNTNIYASSTELFAKIEKYICSIISGCDNILEYIVGNDYKLINSSLIPIINGHNPSGSSILQFVHYGQLYHSGNFCRFDYGPKDNLLKYGRETPPFYNLRNITVPIVLFYSHNDLLSDVADVSILYNHLRNVCNVYNIDKFNHFDYLYASIAKYAVYLNILKEIDEFVCIEEFRNT